MAHSSILRNSFDVTLPAGLNVPSPRPLMMPRAVQYSMNGALQRVTATSL
jgi:hypothetical protein